MWYNYQLSTSKGFFFLYNISPITECKMFSFVLIICSSSVRAMHCTCLVFVVQLFSSLPKTETLAWTLHEQALNTAHYLRNGGSSDGTLYYSGCIVQKNLNFDPCLWHLVFLFFNQKFMVNHEMSCLFHYSTIFDALAHNMARAVLIVQRLKYMLHH